MDASFPFWFFYLHLELEINCVTVISLPRQDISAGHQWTMRIFPFSYFNQSVSIHFYIIILYWLLLVSVVLLSPALYPKPRQIRSHTCFCSNAYHFYLSNRVMNRYTYRMFNKIAYNITTTFTFYKVQNELYYLLFFDSVRL